uniref:Peptidase M13 N-terminal domain-containing protein n=1 Tax=Anopheles albimanus TaxID=7167 RepID=A0A182FJA2_ANOAL
MIDLDRQYWDLRENLQLVQPKYGAAPFFKLGVDTRNQPPYDYMITVGEGDLGLPSKEFYALSEKHPIIRAYHAFLMDTLAHMISTSTENAQDYAKKIYNYEKRIALDVLGAVSRTDLGNFTQPQIRTMHQLVNDAPSLPILEAAQAMFKSKKITEHTEVMVSSPAALKAISQIITTSDKEVLNNYFMWSVIRHFVPFMSREFRVSLHQFEQTLYGAGAAMPSLSPSSSSSSSSSSSESREPMWHFCTNVVRQWMPYGLEALRENPALIVHDQRDANDYHHHHHQHQQHTGGGGAGLVVSQHEMVMQQSRLLLQQQQQQTQQQHHQSLLQQQQQQYQQHRQHHNQEEPQHHRAEYGIGGGGEGEELLMAGIATVGVGGYSQHHYQLNERISNDDELVKVIFYHLRDEFGRALLEARWLSGEHGDERLRRYVADKLASVRLQVGIPRELLRNERILNEYYGQLVLDGLLFVDSVVNQWDFTKSQMTRMLDNQTEVERILTEMFPPRSAAEQLQRERQAGRNHEHYRTPQPNPLVKYSIALNMVLISRQRLRQPYFSHHYPISVNFARLGADIAFALQSAIHTLIEQYRNVELASGAHQQPHPQQHQQNVLDEEAQNCMPRSLIQGFFVTAGSGRLMNETRLNLYLGLSAVTVLTRAFGTLLSKIERNERIYEADILEQTTYEMLGLNRQPALRLPGLQPYDEQQLFTLTYLQRHCTADYNRHRLTKLLIEHDIPEFDNDVIITYYCTNIERITINTSTTTTTTSSIIITVTVTCFGCPRKHRA